jgi:hypothetical protein
MGIYIYQAMGPKFIRQARLSDGSVSNIVPYDFLCKPLRCWGEPDKRDTRLMNLAKGRALRWYQERADLQWIVLTDKTGEIAPGMTAWNVSPGVWPIVDDGELDHYAFTKRIQTAKVLDFVGVIV